MCVPMKNGQEENEDEKTPTNKINSGKCIAATNRS